LEKRKKIERNLVGGWNKNIKRDINVGKRKGEK
jgi:hypothetical protein